ncbi:unnamed protein product [Lymnaea stagnalis]|uniref:G-protein coupled receptors family 1 profile domain-containing protein n=1 Tax=Lymnaea stagnalis TaxID=6523 RepID=A0AAV2IMV5_LYMST
MSGRPFTPTDVSTSVTDWEMATTMNSSSSAVDGYSRVQTYRHPVNRTFNASSSYPDLDDHDLGDLGLKDNSAFFYDVQNIHRLLDPWVREPLFVPTVAIYGVAFLLGLVGNCLVIFAMVGDRKSRSVTASFMVSLAVADLLFLLVCMPSEVAKNFIGHWDSGSVLCKISGAVEMLSAMASVLNLIAVSVERYIVIVHPMKARSWCTVENTKKMLPCVWVVAVGLSAPTLYVWGIERSVFYNNVTTVTVFLCSDIDVGKEDSLIYALYQFLVMFVMPVVVLFFCYTFVIHALWLSSRRLMQMTSHDSSYSTVSTVEDGASNAAPAGDGSHGHSPCTVRHSHIRSRRSMFNKATREHSAEVFRARKQVIKMLVAIILAFLICWGPKLILSLLKRARFQWLYIHNAYIIESVLKVLPFVHSCINPIIYGFMSKNFRTRMKCACRSYVCHKTHPSAVMGKRLLTGSDLELDTRSTNGTVHTKISLRQGSSSQSDT